MKSIHTRAHAFGRALLDALIFGFIIFGPSVSASAAKVDVSSVQCEIYIDRVQLIHSQKSTRAFYVWLKVDPQYVGDVKSVGLRVHRTGVLHAPNGDQTIEDSNWNLTLQPFLNFQDYYEIQFDGANPKLIVSGEDPRLEWSESVLPFLELKNGTSYVGAGINSQPFLIDRHLMDAVTQHQGGEIDHPWQISAARTRDEIPELNPQGCPRYPFD